MANKAEARCLFVGRREENDQDFHEAGANPLVVIFEAEMRDQRLPAHPAQRVFEFHQLYENIVFGIQTGRRHR